MNSAVEAAASAHAARMDRMYRLQRHFYDATRAYYLLGRDHMLQAIAAPPGSSILEIGCGTGRNLIAAGRRYDGVSLFGLDISQAMLETAGLALQRAGLAGRVRLAQADATAFDPTALFGQARFDRVYISYALSMIPDWQAALRQAWAVTAPGGSLHLVDFGGCERCPPGFRPALFAWLRHFDVSPRLELAKLLAAIAKESPSRLRVTPLFLNYCNVMQLEKLKN